jgi:nicotinamide-nucleotide amidase
MFSTAILRAAERLIECCAKDKVRLVFAESCTGGLIAGAATAIPGASRVVDRGFVVYSYESKEQELSVPRSLIERHGAVSQPVAVAMAQGALARARPHGQLSLAVTGVSGPSAPTDKPVGLVHLAAAREGLARVLHEQHQFGDLGRDQVREETVLAALNLALECLHHRDAGGTGPSHGNHG